MTIKKIIAQREVTLFILNEGQLPWWQIAQSIITSHAHVSVCKLSDSVDDKEFLDCPFKYKWCSVVFGGIFSFFSLFYCLRIKASIVQLCLNSYTLTLSTKVLHRNATWTNYSQGTFPCLKSLVVGIIRSLMLWGFFRKFLGYLLRFLKATLIQR